MQRPEQQFTELEREAIAQHTFGIHMDRWARACWKMFNHFAFHQDPQGDPIVAARAIALAAPLLPCHVCRGHMTEYLESQPLTASTWQELRTWLVRFHNSVSTRTGRPARQPADIAAEEAQETAGVDHWWGFVFAVTALYRPEDDAEPLRQFLDASRGLVPIPDGWQPALDTPSALLASLLTVPGATHPNQFSFLADYVPVGMLRAKPDRFPVNAEEMQELQRLFSVRTEGHRAATKRAFDRLSGASTPASLDAFIEPLSLTSTETDTPTGTSSNKLTGGQIAAIVLAVFCGVLLIILLMLIFIPRKSSSNQAKEALRRMQRSAPTGAV